MKNNFVTDTMAFVLRLEKRKLSPTVKNIFQKAEEDNIHIYVPVMVLAEIGYLSEKKRIEADLKIAKRYYSQYKAILIEPITEEIIEKSFTIKDVPDLHDRIIAGTALNRNMTLITNDPVISSSEFVKTIW